MGTPRSKNRQKGTFSSVMATDSFTVLVASQDSVFVKEIEEYLQPFGYRVKVVTDALTALDIIRKERPDLVLAEVELPPLTGYELCQSIKQDPALRVIPFLLVANSYFDTEAKVKGLATGADDLLYRPVHPMELRARIRSSLRLKAYVQQILEDRGRFEELVAERTKDIEQITFGLVAALERANRMNDSDTGVHIKRVSEYSRIMGQGLSLEPVMTNNIARYASLHDVGKVGLPDSILKKEGALTDEEMETMRGHTSLGFELLKEARADDMACRIALYHHERFDGTGYPEGLSGYKIPIEARIVALADVFDAMTTRRCYKSAMPARQAIDEVMAESGKHFDPGVVRVFMERHGEFRKVLDKYGNE